MHKGHGRFVNDIKHYQSIAWIHSSYVDLYVWYHHSTIRVRFGKCHKAFEEYNVIPWRLATLGHTWESNLDQPQTTVAVTSATL